ncbi:MAG: STN domain-containing protein [Flavobacteriales bacterium]|nr:STN domain-containing protein [Flavobacteriales bacterium]
MAQSDLLKNTKVTISVKDTPLYEVIENLEKQTGIKFSYSGSLFPESKKSSINASVESIEDVLNRLFSDYNIEFTEFHDHIIIKKQKGKVSIYKTKEPFKAKSSSQASTSVQEVKREKPKTNASVPKNRISTNQDTSKYISSNNPAFNFGAGIRTTWSYTIRQTNLIVDLIINDSSSHKKRRRQKFKIAESHISTNTNIAYLFPFSGVTKKTTNNIEFSQQFGPIYTGGVSGMFHYNKWGIGIGINWSILTNKLDANFSIDSTVYKELTIIATSFDMTVSDDAFITIYVPKDTSFYKDTLVTHRTKSKTYYHYLEFPLTASFKILSLPKSNLAISVSYLPGLLTETTNNILDSTGFYSTQPKNSVYKYSSALSLGLVSNLVIGTKWELGFYTSYKKYLSPILIDTYFPKNKGNYVSMGMHLTYNFRNKKDLTPAIK